MARPTHRRTHRSSRLTALFAPLHLYSPPQDVVVIALRYSGGGIGHPPPYAGGVMQDAAYGLPRIGLPRRWVNKGKKKGRDP